MRLGCGVDVLESVGIESVPSRVEVANERCGVGDGEGDSAESEDASVPPIFASCSSMVWVM